MEGGGQVLRNGVALAAILQKSVRIVNVRGNRDQPGLKNQHLAGLQLVTEISLATTEGLQIGSSQVTFTPSIIAQHKTDFAAEV